MRRECADAELRTLILDWLQRHGRWELTIPLWTRLLTSPRIWSRTTVREDMESVEELLGKKCILAPKGGGGSLEGR